MLRRQQRKTYLAGGEVDVRVADWCDECYLGRGEGVICRDGDGEEPEAAGVGR